MGTEIGVHAGTLEQAQERAFELGEKGRIISLTMDIKKPVVMKKDVFGKETLLGRYPYEIIQASELSQAEKVALSKNGAALSSIKAELEELNGFFEASIGNPAEQAALDEAKTELKNRFIQEKRRLETKYKISPLEMDADRLIRAEVQEFTEALQAMGYDGFAYLNEVEGTTPEWSYAVLNPDQITITGEEAFDPAQILDEGQKPDTTPEEYHWAMKPVASGSPQTAQAAFTNEDPQQQKAKQKTAETMHSYLEKHPEANANAGVKVTKAPEMFYQGEKLNGNSVAQVMSEYQIAEPVTGMEAPDAILAAEQRRRQAQREYDRQAGRSGAPTKEKALAKKNSCRRAGN